MSAPGETSLPLLLSSLSPHLDPTTWIFLCLSHPSASPAAISPSANLPTTHGAILAAAKMTFHEPEGLTAIIPLGTAVSLSLCTPDGAALSPSPSEEAGAAANESNSAIRTALPSRLITLRVQSSLDAVGMMGAVAGALARAGVPCNVVAGFMHDHLFVPCGMEGAALEALDEVQRGAAAAAAGLGIRKGEEGLGVGM